MLPRLIDYGGACGESILLLSGLFGEDIFKSSWVCESFQQVEESKRWRFAKNIQFTTNLDCLLKEGSPDIFSSSGTIQYLPDPYQPLKAVARSKVPLVALTRNNFSYKPRTVAQRSKLSMNGTGKHLETYGNPDIYYPNTSVVKSRVVEIFQDQGCQVVVDTAGTASGVYGKDNFSGDIILIKQRCVVDDTPWS